MGTIDQARSRIYQRTCLQFFVARTRVHVRHLVFNWFAAQNQIAGGSRGLIVESSLDDSETIERNIVAIQCLATRVTVR